MHDAESNRPKIVVSIVVPMCNEEESIGILRLKLYLLQERLKSRFAVEYCLVDDGSTDATGELMTSVVPLGAACVPIRHASNRGLGAAIRSGLQVASGSIVCTIDADCSYPPEDLASLIDVVLSSSADVAVASPYHPLGGVVGVKPWRILLSRQCSLLYRLVSPLKLHTYTSIFRAYRGTVARQLEFQSDGFVSAVEMLFCAASLGYTVQEVPMLLQARQRGYSKIRIVRTIWTHLVMMSALLKHATAYRLRRRRHRFTSLYSAAVGTRTIPAPVSLHKDERSIR